MFACFKERIPFLRYSSNSSIFLKVTFGSLATEYTLDIHLSYRKSGEIF